MEKNRKKSSENMTEIVNVLEMRTNGIKELEKALGYYLNRINDWIRQIEDALKASPEGRVKIVCVKGTAQYYHILNRNTPNGTYIPRNQQPLAAKLAQKEYDKRLLNELLNQKKAILQLLKHCEPHRLEEFYSQMSLMRREIVSPRILDDTTFASIWSSMEYQSKEIGQLLEHTGDGFITEAGERVRSKSELMIANELHRMGIPYRYECELYLKGIGTIHPDFTILKANEHREIYWEHLGMMDDRGYCSDALSRIDCYTRNGFFPGKSLILTHETSRSPLSTSTIKNTIHEYLLDD